MSEQDSRQPVGPRKLVERISGPANPRYSLCAMVTRWEEYQGCVNSFKTGGFGDLDCEYLVLDNSGVNKADAYVALNEFLQAACGEYIILHHQDVLLLEDGREQLDQKLLELTQVDDRWALCGNAGATDDGWPVLSLSHPHDDRHIVGGPFPTPVMSLDENFMVVRRVANLALSADLSGFHHYAIDLCTIADILGWRSYVISFFLRHNSGGTFDASYDRSGEAIRAKYRRALRSRWAYLITRRHFVMSGSPIWHTTRPTLRKLAKLVGLAPRNNHLLDPAHRARRDARVTARRK